MFSLDPLLVVAVLAASLIHVSIAASQLLLGIGIGLMLVFRRRLEFPRIWLPLAIFFSLTLISVLLSPDPWGGHTQIRKFYVFLLLPLMYSVFSRAFSAVQYVLVGWAIAATVSGLLGLVQFYAKYHHADVTGEDFYTSYVAARITGFESHWMTFGALQLSVFLFLLAHLFFSGKRWPAWSYAVALTIMGTAIILGWTRSIWIASVPAILYLVWFWRPKLIWLAPLAITAVFIEAPGETQDRIASFISPHGATDSNEHRLVTFRTGLEMIKRHPWFGLGPEQIGKQFAAYTPGDITRPLPAGFYGHLHNIYLQYAAERGIPALLAILWLIGLLVLDCAKQLRQLRPGRSQERFVLHATIAFTIAILTEGLFEFNLGDSEVLMMFVTVAGLAYAAIRQPVPTPVASQIRQSADPGAPGPERLTNLHLPLRQAPPVRSPLGH
jgi:putative inorganic carbon (hco3(-)) transporter